MDPDDKRGFRGLLAWRESIELGPDIDVLLPTITGPGSARIRDQLVAACDSIHSNIAEGYGKGICPDYIRFLKIAHASAAEIETRLEGLIARHRVSIELARAAIKKVQRVRALIWGLIRWVEAQLRLKP